MGRKFEFSNFINFVECQFVDEFGIGYPSPEHAYQAHKTNDVSKRVQISMAESPRYAKYLGRRVWIVKNWEEIKEDVMYKIQLFRFTEDKALQKRLLETGYEEIVEWNKHHDNEWGVCTCGKCHGGQNKLGKIIMKIREELVKERSLV